MGPQFQISSERLENPSLLAVISYYYTITIQVEMNLASRALEHLVMRLS